MSSPCACGKALGGSCGSADGVSDWHSAERCEVTDRRTLRWRVAVWLASKVNGMRGPGRRKPKVRVTLAGVPGVRPETPWPDPAPPRESTR